MPGNSLYNKKIRNYEKSVELLEFVINQKKGDFTTRALANNLMSAIYLDGHAVKKDTKSLDLGFKEIELGDYYPFLKLQTFIP